MSATAAAASTSDAANADDRGVGPEPRTSSTSRRGAIRHVARSEFAPMTAAATVAPPPSVSTNTTLRLSAATGGAGGRVAAGGGGTSLPDRAVTSHPVAVTIATTAATTPASHDLEPPVGRRRELLVDVARDSASPARGDGARAVGHRSAASSPSAAPASVISQVGSAGPDGWVLDGSAVMTHGAA